MFLLNNTYEQSSHVQYLLSIKLRLCADPQASLLPSAVLTLNITDRCIIRNFIFLQFLFFYFCKALLLFKYPGIWLQWLFLEQSPCVKQAEGLTFKSALGGWRTQHRLIYQWIVCSASKPLKCIVVAAVVPERITLRSDCLHDGESGGGSKAEVKMEREENEAAFYLSTVECEAAILTSLWKQLRFPFSKIFFPYLSDPTGGIHLSALTLASSSKSKTRPASLRHTHRLTHTHTCCRKAYINNQSRFLCCICAVDPSDAPKGAHTGIEIKCHENKKKK